MLALGSDSGGHRLNLAKNIIGAGMLSLPVVGAPQQTPPNPTPLNHHYRKPQVPAPPRNFLELISRTIAGMRGFSSEGLSPKSPSSFRDLPRPSEVPA